jgi:hypothetical protein
MDWREDIPEVLDPDPLMPGRSGTAPCPTSLVRGVALESLYAVKVCPSISTACSERFDPGMNSPPIPMEMAKRDRVDIITCRCPDYGQPFDDDLSGGG